MVTLLSYLVGMFSTLCVMKDASKRPTDYALYARIILISFVLADNVSLPGNLMGISVLLYGKMDVATFCRWTVNHAHGDALCNNQDYAHTFVIILSELEDCSMPG